MTLEVAVLGVDGSGKSTVAAALPALLAAECGIVAGAAGEEFRVAAPDEDLLAPSFHPDGLPFAARLARRFKRRAKELVDDRKRYPFYKLAQMLLQDAAARKLARRYRADVFVSDGNTLLSATGRAANYRRPASEQQSNPWDAPDADDLVAVFRYILEDEPLPEASAARLPRLESTRTIKRLLKLFRLDAVWLPDVVVFLDSSPENALARIRERGGRLDLHENIDDLRQTREMYAKTLQAYVSYRKDARVVEVDVDHLDQGDVLAKVVGTLRSQLLAAASSETRRAPLGTTTEDLSPKGFLAKALNARYLVYLVTNALEGAWREPLFPFSRAGRLFLKEGYSAGVMRAIYDAPESPPSLLDRAFQEYPLHRAGYDRLQILTARIGPELESRLGSGASLKLLSAPSGFAYDLFRPLESIARSDPEAMKRICLLAADLDPQKSLERELSERARALGIQFQFVRGDLTSFETQETLAREGPFDIGLFVGLSSWISKPALVRHLRFLREQLGSGGVLVTDAFTPGAYALSGKYVGYRAHYYEPSVFQSVLDFCGFDARSAAVESGRDELNHVLVLRPRPSRVKR